MYFHEILQSIMEEKKLTIPDVARMSGLPDSTVRSIINRKNKTVALEVAFKLSKGLNVSLEKLNGENLEVPVHKETMFINGNEPMYEDVLSGLDFNDNVKELTKQYSLLNESDRELVKNMINSLFEKISQQQK